MPVGSISQKAGKFGAKSSTKPSKFTAKDKKASEIRKDKKDVDESSDKTSASVDSGLGADDKGEPVVEIEAGRPCVVCKDACTGFGPHRWRRSCTNCRHNQEDHELNLGPVNVRERLGWAAKPDDPNKTVNQELTEKMGFAWIPPGLGENEVQSFVAQLPNDKVPRLGSPGERWREVQIVYQIPKQDLSDKFCSSLRHASDRQEYFDFIEKRDDMAMDIGFAACVTEDSLCYRCDQPIPLGGVSVFAKKANEAACWHPNCFVCTKCNELLVDLVYCHRQGKLYCERHYAELLKPRCAGCEELIFCPEYTKAMGDDFHNEHFTCANCEQSLVGHRYILRDERPHCIKCYEELFANKCHECKNVIGVDFKDLSYKDMHWHEKCFHCSDCQKSLVDEPFAHKEQKLYCADCHDINFAPRCDGCEGIFKGGMKKYEYRGKQWHEDCFCCLVCKKPIGPQSFIPRDQDVVCVPCYEEKFAQRCMKCGGVINKGGVTYKEDPWHRECFQCTNCEKLLAPVKFTSKDDKPYCVECYGELFANKCIKCTKPIMGLGGTKFISFDGKYWHSDCFGCYRCNTSLVGRGFLVNGDEVVCPPCGR